MPKIAKRLTKQDLIEMGFESVTWNEEEEKWDVVRNWFCNRSKVKMKRYILKENIVTCKHKYASDKQYKSFMFNYRGKMFTMPVARLVMAWIEGEVPHGYDVDHIDNNPFNNRLENLQILSHAENLNKMYGESGKGHNQWSYKK